MTRQRKYTKRKASQRPFDLDVIIPGLSQFTGRSDRFRCSAETRDPQILAQRRAMVVDLGQRMLHDVLAGRLRGQFSTEELATAYREGPNTLRGLLARSQANLLAPLLEKWMVWSTARSKDQYARQALAFIDFCGGKDRAATSDLTTDKIALWLSQLVDERRGKAGAPITSASRAAIAARRKRALKSRGEPAKARDVTNGTRNRYRAAISSFCTYLVRTGELSTHPLRERRLPGHAEADARMPDMDQDEWTKYCHVMSSDPLAPEPSLLVAMILRHCGPDVGEVLGQATEEEDWLNGMVTADVLLERIQPRLRFKRRKVVKSPTRLVPIPAHCAHLIRNHIARYSLTRNDVLFGMTSRSEFESAHRRTARAIGRSDLRLKDFRHLAAITWAKAGVPLQHMKEWLGHSNIQQTEIYARFAPDDDFDAPLVERAASLTGSTAHPVAERLQEANSPEASQPSYQADTYFNEGLSRAG